MCRDAVQALEKYPDIIFILRKLLCAFNIREGKMK